MFIFLLKFEPDINQFVYEIMDQFIYALLIVAYKLYKMACQEPLCGFKAAHFLCKTDIGCMNHNITSQYIVTINCSDAYGSVDSQDFTFDVIKNEAPIWRTQPSMSPFHIFNRPKYFLE